MGGKFSKKKGYSANKAKGTRTEEEGTLKETETQVAMESPEVKEGKEDSI